MWKWKYSPVRAQLRAAGKNNIAVAIVLSASLAAQTQSKSAPATKTSPKPSTAQANAQKVTEPDSPQLYRNPTFGFRYQIPYSWVDRTAEMQKENDAGKSEVLLAAFERPPDATGEGVNAAVVIAAESTKSYPGLKRAEDYLAPLTELATAKGFKAEGEPYELEEESRHLVRADFTKPLNDKITMRQCTLVLLAKGQIISFTFIAGSEDELNNIMDGLHFGSAKPAAAK